MSKQFWLVILVVAAILGGIFWATGRNDNSNNTSSNVPTGLTHHVKGKGQKGVTLVEYGDYECPACYGYEPTVDQVFQKYQNDIYLQFRNFPLVSLHKNAFAGARAAEAADMQGKFWEMHDALYANQDPNGQSGWVAASDPLSFFDQFAKNIGLNVDKFNADYASSAVNDRITADMAEGDKLGITGTPTFFLDGKELTNIPNTVDAFSQAINAEIAKKAPAKTSTSANTTPTNTTTDTKQ